jgi:hypothetical protein
MLNVLFLAAATGVLVSTSALGCSLALSFPPERVAWPVPDLHSRFVGVKTKNAKRPGIQQEMLSALNGEADPPRCQYAQHVTVSEQGNISFECSDPRNYLIHSPTDLLWHLATGTSVSEDHLARIRFVNLFGRQTLIFAVVPLHQIRIDDGCVTESRQIASLACALQWADEY